MSILIGAKRDRFEVKISVTASIIINITKDEQYCFRKAQITFYVSCNSLLVSDIQHSKKE